MTKTTQPKLIKDYEITSADNIEQLQSLVRAAIVIGWQPYGGVCLNTWTSHSTNHQWTQFIQAMVKYAD